MDKGKILNIILLSMIMTLALQFFLPKNNQPGTISQSVYLQAKKESITIPNIPVIELINKSTGSINIQPCQDIKLTMNSIPLTGIQENMPKFCSPLTIVSGSSAILPLRELHTVFASTA
jgi:hypothetical protein